MEKVHEHFKIADRGKLIMACGTGKTFTSLKIAENETNGNGLILFLVPSIALLGQTLREWSAQADKPIHPICICSDAKSTQQKDIDGTVVDLALPASTDVWNIKKQYMAAKIAQQNNGGMIVVFSTYQSIDVISKAQEQINKQEKDSFIFDLVICDEAHRTTGVILANKEDASFTKVHYNNVIRAHKRLYMTATPRLYTDSSKKKAEEGKHYSPYVMMPRYGGKNVKETPDQFIAITIALQSLYTALVYVNLCQNNKIDIQDITNKYNRFLNFMISGK